MNKIVIGFIVTVIFVLIFSVLSPIYADKPENPGLFGSIVSSQNHDDEGRAYYVHLTQDYADQIGTNMGQVLKQFLGDFCGIPAKHIP